MTTVAVGQRVELARYELPTEMRVLYGQRVRGAVRIFDKPAEGSVGRSHLVEAGLHSKDELDAIVADYLEQAERLGDVAAIAWQDQYEESAS